MPSLIVVVPCTLGQTVARVDGPGELVPGVVVPDMPGIDPVLLPWAPPLAVVAVGDEPAAVPMAGGEAASVSDVAATNTAAVATEATPVHHTLPAIPMAVHRSRT
jgi:hypothetical protein